MPRLIASEKKTDVSQHVDCTSHSLDRAERADDFLPGFRDARFADQYICLSSRLIGTQDSVLVVPSPI